MTRIAQTHVLGLLITFIATVTVCKEASAQLYAWARTQDTLTARSRVTATVQEIQEIVDDPDTGNGLVATTASFERTRPVLGGGGGDGGGGAFQDGLGGEHGDDGDEASGLNGSPGADAVADGGGGGLAGGQGYADVTANAETIDELNPDGQLVMQWSFIHSIDGSIELAGAGGGGAGGGGGDNGDPEHEAFGGEGGYGGNGGAATGSINTCSQGSGVNVIGTLQAGPTFDPNTTPTQTSAGAMVNIAWSTNGNLVDSGQWTRSVNLTIVINATTLNITGQSPDPLTASGTSTVTGAFFKQSSAPLDSDLGDLTVGPDDFWDNIAIGQNGQIFSTGQDNQRGSDSGLVSQFSAWQTAGGGGGGEADLGPGVDAGNGLGGGGGAGGAGGAGANGGMYGPPGGPGGKGHRFVPETEHGFFQGYAGISVNQ